MTIKNSKLKVPIIFNLIVVFVLYFDFFIPSNRIIIEEFSSFYSSVTYVPGYRTKAKKDIRNILECKSGNLYYLTVLPTAKNQLEVGQEIFIHKTIFLSKLKSIKVSENQIWKMSFLSNQWIMYSFVLSFIVTLLNFRYEHVYLDFLLSFATGFILMATGYYLYYF